MSSNIAIKSLQRSDMAFFQSYLDQFPQAKNRGFVLDRRVLEKFFFPSLNEIVGANSDLLAPLALTVIGPGAAAPFLLMRRLTKMQSTWTLNREAIHNPIDAPTRFNLMAPGDIAVMEFSGASIPTHLKLVLLSAADPADASTHAAFKSAFPGPAMRALTEDDVEKVVQAAGTPVDHPIRDWLDKGLLEGLGQGDADAETTLRAKRKGRSISAAELNKATAAAEAVGRLGEELLDYHLETAFPTWLASHVWVSDADAIAPFDFLLHRVDGTRMHLDVKSTARPFGNRIHMSLGEMQHAVSGSEKYDLYRLYEVTDSCGKFRIAHDIAGKLKPILETLAGLPDQAKVDSLSFSPDFFDFELKETVIEYPDEIE